MPNGKAPGPNGFTIDFFKACSTNIKEEVYTLVEESRTHKSGLKALNTTFLTLIPKEEGVDSPERSRPIKLCNVIYKILSTTLANRIKIVLPLLIFPNQSSYVEGRQILDNIILSHELLHSLKVKKKLGMLMQLDMSEAFDKISWDYMKGVLEAFGFNKDSIKWIMAIFSGAFFSILLNGSPFMPFCPSRGIRQGDPLSPFLFVVMAKGLTRSIMETSSCNSLFGLKLHVNVPPSTHQRFVDDTLLMGLPTIK